jgi:hypothetical protein
MPERKTGHSVTFKVDDDNNGSYTEIAQVQSINGANVIENEEIDATTLSDPISPYMIPASVPTIPQLTVVIAFDPNTSTHATLRSLAAARTSFGAQVVFANYSTTKTWQCSSGFIADYSTGEVTSRGLMTATVVFRPQALPTFT